MVNREQERRGRGGRAARCADSRGRSHRAHVSLQRRACALGGGQGSGRRWGLEIDLLLLNCDHKRKAKTLLSDLILFFPDNSKSSVL